MIDLRQPAHVAGAPALLSATRTRRLPEARAVPAIPDAEGCGSFSGPHPCGGGSAANPICRARFAKYRRAARLLERQTCAAWPSVIAGGGCQRQAAGHARSPPPTFITFHDTRGSAMPPAAPLDTSVGAGTSAGYRTHRRSRPPARRLPCAGGWLSSGAQRFVLEKPRLRLSVRPVPRRRARGTVRRGAAVRRSPPDRRLHRAAEGCRTVTRSRPALIDERTTAPPALSAPTTVASAGAGSSRSRTTTAARRPVLLSRSPLAVAAGSRTRAAGSEFAHSRHPADVREPVR